MLKMVMFCLIDHGWYMAIATYCYRTVASSYYIMHVRNTLCGEIKIYKTDIIPE